MKKRGKFRKALDQPWAAMTFAACAGVVLFVLLSHLGLIGKGLVKLYGFVEPVFIGLVIAYVTDPLVVFYEEHVFRKVGRKNIRRGLSVAATYLSIVVFIALILVSLIPQLISSVRLFISNLDSYSSAFNVLMKDLTDWAASHNVDISKYTSVGSDIVGLITSSLPQSVDGILNKTITYGKNVFDAVIAIIIAIYFLCKLFENSLKVAYIYTFINNQTFYLMENRGVSCINLVSSINSAWADYAYRRFS